MPKVFFALCLVLLALFAAAILLAGDAGIWPAAVCFGFLILGLLTLIVRRRPKQRDDFPRLFNKRSDSEPPD